MRRRIIVLAVAALLSVAGCDAAFGGTNCHHGDRGPAPTEPSGQSGFQDG
jgi:hypothetical protein